MQAVPVIRERVRGCIAQAPQPLLHNVVDSNLVAFAWKKRMGLENQRCRLLNRVTFESIYPCISELLHFDRLKGKFRFLD